MNKGEASKRSPGQTGQAKLILHPHRRWGCNNMATRGRALQCRPGSKVELDNFMRRQQMFKVELNRFKVKLNQLNKFMLL